MDTGTKVLDSLVDELNELGLKTMASSLEDLYHSKDFVTMDSLSLIAELIKDEYHKKMTTRIENRLKKAKLFGCPYQLEHCVDSKDREYFPDRITYTLSNLNFIRDGMNVCILGPSDSGKTYLAKALGINACTDYRVAYHHCETFLESMVNLKMNNFKKYQKDMGYHTRVELLILDDFLLHTLSDEREVKILFELLEGRAESFKSTIVCSQREPQSWTSMMMNDEVTSNAILKRVTKHYTVVVQPKETD